ncbi:siderophore-interacting protein [Streptomyces humi]|uniref:siderophore-interacting protein n=1 Tax=Streptomyces humi TaxID=1428620 RepID=UPI0006286DC7|nr:siderophore-interacting protein [Streptomyces humi]
MNARFPMGVRRRMLTVEVARREWLGPHLARVTLTGADLADFVHQGGDQCFRLFFPRPGQRELRMPTLANNGWYAQLLTMPGRVRPNVRNMTVRSFRADVPELDMDVAVHGDTPLSVWVRSVVAGSPAGVFDEGRGYRPPADAASQLLIADESALAAAVATAETTRATLPTRLLLEVPTSDDVQDLDLGEHVEVDWLPRDDPAVKPGELALRRVRELALPAAPVSVFVAGESALATGARRALVAAGVPKAAIDFTGYWKQGREPVG